MDRSQDLLLAAERFLQSASLPPDQARQLREALLFGRRSRTSPPGNFAVAAKGVEDSINTLWDSIISMQREYAAPGAMSLPDPAKDDNEAQVAAFVKRIGGYVERLKEAAAQAGGHKGSGANEHTVAHMHGVVLILAERLTRATLAFDRLRAARYQALVAAQQPPPAPSASGAGGGAAAVDGRGGAGHRHGRTQGSGAGSPTAGSRGSSGLGLARGVLTAAARSGWNNIVGAGGGQQATGSTSSGAGRGRGTGAGGRGQGGGDWSGAAGGAGGVQEAQQVQAMEQENRALLERLTARRDAVLGVESAVRDVAALNQMFSTAVLAQAETIETIYMAAVEATENLKAGNVSLTKTVAVNRSTTRYLVVLLLVATLSLLLFDWLNS